MYTISASLNMRFRKTDCVGEDTRELDTWVRKIVAEVHSDVRAKLHPHGFTVEASGVSIYLPGDDHG